MYAARRASCALLMAFASQRAGGMEQRGISSNLLEGLVRIRHGLRQRVSGIVLQVSSYIRCEEVSFFLLAGIFIQGRLLLTG